MGKVTENFQGMLSKLENFITTKTVVGEPIIHGDVIIIPLIEATIGAGTGMGEKNKETEGGETGGGGAMGAKITPVAIVVVSNGSAQLVNVKNQESLGKLIDMLPGALSKLNLTGIFGKDSKNEKSDKNKETDAKE